MQDNTTDSEATEETSSDPGAILRAAREEAGINIDEAAEKLHLDRSIVLALEEGNYEILGAPVFVRGHLRRYAQILGLQEDELASSYEVVEPEAEEFRTLSAQTVVKSGANLSNFFLWVLLTIIVLIGTIYFLVGNDETPSSDFVAPEPAAANPEQEALEVPAEISAPASSADDLEASPEPASVLPDPPVPDVQVAEVASADDQDSEAGLADFRADVEVAAPLVTEPEPVAEPEPEVVAEPGSPLLSLSLRFTAECWVEVSDSRRRLLYGLEKAGSERLLKGIPPFRLFLGNTDAVELRIAEQEYVVPRSVRTGSNTARFVIDDEIIAGLVGR